MIIPQFAPEDYPIIVFTDNNANLIASAIKWRTAANYSHAMWMIAPGVLASQGFVTYEKIPIQRYMGPRDRIKFVGMNGISTEGRKQIILSIQKKLSGPWYKKLYDYVGIFGQLTGLRFIQTPFFSFCSEDQPYHLQKVELEFPVEFSLALSDVIRNLPKNGSPGVHDEYSKKHRDVFPLLGRWEGDEAPAA